ncbi:MAG: hypothetical protein Q9186_005721 [Xanthomendoza sp. 1 TL-2023]
MDSFLPTLTPPFYGGIITIVFLFAWFIVRIRGNFSPSKKPQVHRTHALDRKPGTWPASSYRRPPASPYPEWSVYETKPLPYRPFKYGPKFPITMGLRSMPMDDWLELDCLWPQFHTERTTRIAELGGKVSQTTSEGLAGAYELLDEFRNYLPERYPTLFRKTDVGIQNLLTGEHFNTVERPLKQDPMQMAGSMAQEDLAILVERTDGQYYLVGGAICTRGVWCLEERLGMPLSQIHISYGKVPHFKEKLEKGVMSLFRRIQPDKPVQRNTWYIIGEDAINNEGFTVGAGKMDMPEENFYFKTERQTVRRLPRSGAIAFHFRTYTVPIVDIATEPYAPGRLASAIRSWDDETAKYKGRVTFDRLLSYLDSKHEEQVADGLDLSREDEVHKHPY